MRISDWSSDVCSSDLIQPDAFDLSSRSVILPIVPMFHANSWGVPYAAATVGAKLVFSATNDAQVLCDLMHDAGVTPSAGVPTAWIAMFAHLASPVQIGRAPLRVRVWTELLIHVGA